MIVRSMVTLDGHPRKNKRTVFLKDGGRPVAIIRKERDNGFFEWRLLGFNEKPHSNANSWEEAVSRIIIALNGK
jgi:hypothetical protein